MLIRVQKLTLNEHVMEMTLNEHVMEMMLYYREHARTLTIIYWNLKRLAVQKQLVHA